MNKKIKKFSNVDRNSNYSLVDPEVVSMDDLAYAADMELTQRAEGLRSDREKAIRAGVSTRKWEVELAYVQREMIVRDDRADAHMIYERSLWGAQPSDSVVN